MPPIERIVLVDDNDLDNSFHTIILKKAGFAGELAVLESGVQLVDVMRRETQPVPTLLFIDINMPVLNGFETIKKLVELSLLNGEIQTYILSSSDAASDMQMARSVPQIKGFLVKPLNVEDVRRLLAA
ncbi:MAG: response regulator [Hydrogenophaga sp.]|uniref:response regulator n=1 Tax=Hydrogenophaga sp. TaxID=1904254 RepID=UPI0025BDF7D1|nr:response regulator [Hydrogenophaga sp.]MBU7575344.1 response regulator [Hydrogenophaga sp.]